MIIDSPGKVSSSENGAAYLIHEELSVCTLHPEFLPVQLRLSFTQTVINIFVLQEASSYDVRLQTILFELLISLHFKNIEYISLP